MSRSALVLGTLLATGGLAAGAIAASADDPDPRHGHGGGSGHGARHAAATLRGPDGALVGRVKVRTRGARSEVAVRIYRLPGDVNPSDFHGLHVHGNDDPANGEGCVADPAQPAETWFTAVDGHWAGDGGTHGDHAGDMPSPYLQADGSAYLAFQTDAFGADDLRGRAVILHAERNNFGNIPLGDGPEEYTANSPAAVELTEDTGNSGDRIACGVVR